MPITLQGELVLVKASAVNLNSTGEVLTQAGLPARFIVNRLVISNWSATPSALLAMTLRDTAAGAGNSLVGALAALNTPITATALAAVAYPFAAVLGASRAVTTGNIFLNASVANGTALTADVLIEIQPL